MIKLTDLLQEVLPSSGSLTEDKLYSKNIIDATTNRIGDKSEATLNKLAIAGLFRNQFGDIQKLKDKKQLDDVFTKWYKSTLAALVKTSAFPDDKALAKTYLDAYIGNIRTLGDKARPFSIKKVEGSLVDLVNNKRWLGDEVSSKNAGIYNPDDEDIVYEDDDILILDSKTKAKCVKYGAGESWCIGKPTLNYYNTYRLNYGATPYHVLQKNVEGNEHKLVIMNYGNRGYAIADRSNSGDRGGGSGSAMSWDAIEEQLPNLKGKEKYFPYREITQEERNYASILSTKYTRDNLQDYITNTTTDLVVNGSKVEPVDFIRDYVANNHALTDRQIASLSDEIKDSLVESGYFLTKGVNQTGVLNDRQKKRVIRLKLENKIALTEDELVLIKNDSNLLEAYKSTVRAKLSDFLSAGSYYQERYRLTYAELIVLGSAEISTYVNAMKDKLIRLFLRDEGLDKLAFLKEYGGDNKSVKSISASYEALNNADEDALNDLLPSGIKVDISRDTITLEHLNDDDIDPNTIQLLNRLADDVWDGGYYDDYYDGREDSLNDDYLDYIGEAINNDAEFAEAMRFYGLGKTAEEIGNSFDDYDLKDDIIDTIKEVMNEASEEAKQASWREIYDTASDIINLDCGYRNRGSDCDLRLNLNSFILSGGYMLFELEDPIEDFYSSLDSVLENYLELYADKIPTSTDDIWDQVNDNNMTPNHNKITDMIIEKGDELIEKINDEEDEGDNDVEELSPIELVIEKFKDTLRGLKQSEHSDYIENKLVKIQFDKRRLRRDNSIYVKMLDKTNNKTTEGYMKIDDIPVYFTNYKLAMGESVRASLRKALLR
jgi:hypothetical protein